MGADFEYMTDSNGKPMIKFIDKGFKKVNVGSKLSDFDLLKELGKGHFGKVYLVSSRITGLLYAMKEIRCDCYKNKEQLSEVEREIKLLENLHHPHVITYFTSFRENYNIYIITDYINGGNLEELLKINIQEGKLIDEKKIWDLLVQSLSGLLYLHKYKKIIHRDIKPDNLLLDKEGNLKISDFGISAIKSENVEELLKCHGTVAGPIQFMSPEMAQGINYDYKSDLYMLGLTFFFLMSKQMPEQKVDFGSKIISIKNQNVKLPQSYSSGLRNFILKLLNPPNLRPDTERAYYDAILFYGDKYLNNTSICSTLQCLFSIPSIGSYFTGEKINTIVEKEKSHDDKKYIITKIVKKALIFIDPTNFNYDIVKEECLKLRLIFYIKKDKLVTNPEISLDIFVPDLLNNLHSELNKYIPKKKNPGINNINMEDGNDNDDDINEEIIDQSNEKEVLSGSIKKYVKKFQSEISDKLYFLLKNSYECSICQKNIRFKSNICHVSYMRVHEAGKYLNKIKLNISDLFKNFKKKRLLPNANLFCQNCGRVIKQIYLSISFYTSPLNFIIRIENEDENIYKLNIDENINISEFVERKDVCKINYYLVGAIFIEQNEDEEKRYVSFTRLGNNDWVYYNGYTVDYCTFDDLVNHTKPQMLFYSSK